MEDYKKLELRNKELEKANKELENEYKRLAEACRDTNNDLIKEMGVSSKLREELLELKKVAKNFKLDEIRAEYEKEINILKAEIEEYKSKITLQTRTREITDKQVQEIKELRASGLSYRAIEEKTKWSRFTIGKAIKGEYDK